MSFLLRSLMFVPGGNPRFLEKAPTIPADLICIDLEDSIAPGEKAKAREVVREQLPSLARPNYSLFVRVNGIQTGLIELDLAAVVGPELDGISLPKTDSPEIVRQVDAYLTQLERERGLPVGQVKIIPWIETALGVVNAYAICKASSRLIGASFGGEDYATDMEIKRTPDSKEIEYPRNVVAVACKAARVQPIDTPEPDFRDLDHLERDSLFALSLGYRGKYCIHPTQVDVVNRVFAPTEAEIGQAQAVAQAYEDGEKRGLGAVALDGVMIDRPIYIRARRVLEWAESSRRE